MRFTLRAAIGLFVLVSGHAWAQKGGTAIAAEALTTGSTIQYDQRPWKLVKQATAVFEAGAGPWKVLLLESLTPTSTGGADQPLDDVKLVVLGGGRVIYDYVYVKQGDFETGFYMDDYLDVRDVTYDGVPEVLFHSGYQGTSDSTAYEHILRFDKTKMSFTDIAPASFTNSFGSHGLRWLTSKGRTFVVIAERNWSPSVPDEYRCHTCVSPFQYDAYEWSKETASFVHHGHVNGRSSYFDTPHAFTGDWALIQSELTN